MCDWCIVWAGCDGGRSPGSITLGVSKAKRSEPSMVTGNDDDISLFFVVASNADGSVESLRASVHEASTPDNMRESRKR